MSHVLEPNVVKFACFCGHLSPITKLYFCRHCLKLRCGFCVCHEVIQWTTPHHCHSRLIIAYRFRWTHISAVTAWKIFRRPKRNWRRIAAVNASIVPVVSIPYPRGAPRFKWHAAVQMVTKKRAMEIRRRQPRQAVPPNRWWGKCIICRVWHAGGRLETWVCPIKQLVCSHRLVNLFAK